MKLKSFLNFINESEESDFSLDFFPKMLFDNGILTLGEYIKASLENGTKPEGVEEVEVFFEFDFTWADQHETDEAIELIKEYYTGVDAYVPNGCWVDPETIDVEEMGWSINREDEDEVDYGNSAVGSMIMWVPPGISKEDLDEWADNQADRLFSYVRIGDDSSY